MARLALAFLQTFHVILDAEPITRFRSNNNQGLLVYLALQAGRPLSRETLATLFWPEEPETTARNNLRQSIYRLRQLLGDLDDPAEPFLLVTGLTVQFNENSDYSLDVANFQEAIDQGDLTAAADLYPGELLPGFTCDSLEFEDWLRLEREGLHQLALEALSELSEEHLRHGRLDQAQITARRQLKFELWRESAHRQLMRALALSGDRGNALGQYERCRELLSAELGVEPMAETVALYEEIQSGRLAPPALAASIPPPTRRRHNLPADTTPFIGRELALAELTDRLARDGRRLVTIVGPGGMGKTRLGLAAGRALLDDFAEGVFFVDLAPIAQPDDLPVAIAAALDYQAPDRTQPLLPQLTAALRQRHLLLILDNFEQLLAGVALVDELLKGCPRLSILVTSRQRLNLASESRFELGGLDFPTALSPEDALDYTAVRLFVDSGRRARSDFDLAEGNVAEVIRICQLVQGMPLALVLAAAWLDLLAPAEIATEIEGGLAFLAADLADLPPRQRSMQAVFERSWSMLDPAEQQVLARLSVFRGGFSREAAEQVAGANLRHLLALVNKSLVQRQAQDGRFMVHELLRQYAAEQRRALDPADQAALAHCRFFTRLVQDEVRRALYFFTMSLPARHAADRENLYRAWHYALEHGRAKELSGMARAMVHLGFARGIRPAAIPAQAIQRLQSRGWPATDPAMLDLRLVELSAIQGIEAQQEVEEQLLAFVPLVEEFGDPELRFWTYERLYRHFTITHHPAALDWLERSCQAAADTGQEGLVKLIELDRLWYYDTVLNRPPADIAERQQALLAYFEPAYPDSVALLNTLQVLADRVSAQGDYDTAVSYGRRALNIAKRWQDLYWITQAADGLTNTYLQVGLLPEARRPQLDTLEWHLTAGEPWQLLGFLSVRVVAVPPEVYGGRANGVALQSMVYHHPEAIPHYRWQIDDDRPRLVEQMGRAAYEAAWERGKSLDLETAVAQLRATLGAGRSTVLAGQQE